jgi:hypothetical protein
MHVPNQNPRSREVPDSQAWPRSPTPRLNTEPKERMLPKYKVAFDIDPHGRAPASHFTTDDPVTCEGFLADLLERKVHIGEILHDGVPLGPKEFDGMIRTAVLLLASRHVCAALRISTDEAHVRFGLPA